MPAPFHQHTGFRRIVFGAGLFAAILQGGAAHATLRLCNQSFDVLNVALAEPEEQGFRSRGWWRVAPSQCATLERMPLRSRFFYVFAADVFGKEVLSGAIPMCVAPRRFETSDQEDCLLRGYLDARFLEVDTGEQTNWTIFVVPRPE
ncbi:MAG: DUF1036 domain-containing protein [Paracoccus sp. (in: a-proteobacteria)]|uniref:DUF1036 domain-containing protein n=1 Tax=Paracoccus sp. TaxID=267 RepID=UPI0026E01174|nr:DUF1036 domain-containing protein [Paracoccus sp. (in: a-proteobacteria)]MDO5622781.1 DUF1036 domain-containing protein [Paracoccus sp. (in: a-proteobacteria)]